MLNLFEILSKSLDNGYDAESVYNILRDFFSKNFNTTDLEIFVINEKQNLLKNFSKDWIYSDENKIKDFDKKLILSKITENTYFLNEDYLYYILPKNCQPIGFLKIKSGNTVEIIEFLKTASYLISLKIQNILLAKSMQKNIDFHEIVRNIAKIIETQYELSYIIPLIGEMIDKFMTNHLIYIFIKNNEKFELTWPSKCSDNSIYSILENLPPKSEYKITNSEKTGFFPLISENKLIGCIVVKSMENKISNIEISYLEQLAKQSSATINRANVYAEILKHATLDALTGFYNRRQLEERIKQETAKAKRQKTPLCAIMIDIDFFKRINDIYGHAAGDLVLKTVSKTMRSQLREYDVAGRYGGEEFAVLLPFTKTEEAFMVAERLRKSVENTKIDLSKINHEIQNKIINVTISLGIYEFKYSDDCDSLLKEADKALYIAKESGRNKIVVRTDDKK